MNTLRLFVFLASLIGSFEMLYAATDSSNNLFETEAKDEIILKNNSYSIKIIKKLKGAPSIEIQRLDEKTISRKLSPTLTVIYAVKDPVYGRGGISEGSSPVASWGGQREINLWEQGEQIVLTATGLLVHDEQTVIFQFAEQEKFVIELKVNLPEESAAPEFSWSIKAKKTGGIQ
jgi:hypothetical protein